MTKRTPRLEVWDAPTPGSAWVSLTCPGIRLGAKRATRDRTGTLTIKYMPQGRSVVREDLKAVLRILADSSSSTKELEAKVSAYIRQTLRAKSVTAHFEPEDAEQVVTL